MLNDMNDKCRDGITVILSTFNRANDLRETLEAFCLLDLTGLQVEFVVVDNNSKDETPEVIDSFMARLPLVHLKEARQGKNCALNKALDDVALKELVIFTDDDITPLPDWLQQIASACENWPQYSVFGGAVRVKWPGENYPPVWCGPKWIQSICFATNEADGEEERPYPEGVYPFGPNLWVRSTVFSDGYRYNENIGPRPTKRLMGSETSFLIGLAKKGYSAVLIPRACVQHRPQDREITQEAVLKRGYRYGRSQPHLDRLKGPWKINLASQLLQCLHGLASIVLSYIPGNSHKRFASRFGGLVRLGKAKESIVLAFNDFWQR